MSIGPFDIGQWSVQEFSEASIMKNTIPGEPEQIGRRAR